MEGFDLFGQNKRDLNRITTILDVLAKFEIGNIADRIRIGEKLQIRRPKPQKMADARYRTPQERARMMLEELGPTFVKFGQILSTRADIIGPEYALELSKLQDHMKPFPVDKAKAVVKQELGRPADKIFRSFEDEPLASASIAQVHRATLKDGRKVVVKIQRPGIEEVIKEDLRIMHYLAHMAEKYVPDSHKYDPEYLVDEFERSILKELDFVREAKSAIRLKENFKGDRGIYIPAVYGDLCTGRVMVIEEVKGIRLVDVIKSGSGKFNKKLIAHRCVAAFFKMVLKDGFYHADLHPGNIIILDNNCICLLDFGRVGTIDKETAERIFRLALFAVDDDVNGLMAHLIRTGMLNESSDLESLKADMSDLLDKYYSANIKDVKIGYMLSDMVFLIGKYEFNRPRELAELTRALLILDGVCTQLDPKFNISQEFAPYAKTIMPQEFDMNKFAEIINNNLIDLEYMASTLPLSLRRFIKKMEEGKLKIELEHKDLTYFSTNLETVGNRLSTALILSAMIVGSALIVKSDLLLGLAGFVISIFIALVLLLKTLLY